MSSENRNRYYKLLQVGKKQLGMDEDTYRCFLLTQGAKGKAGYVSATTLSIGQLSTAVEAMKKKGFRPKPKRGSVGRISDWRKPRIKKITALWCALADAGVVRNRSEAAMVTWCATLTHKPRLEWAISADLNACIEALKDWAHREGVRVDG